MKYDSDLNNLKLYVNVGYKTTKYILEDRKVQELIGRDDLHFDLILAEQFYQEAMLMFAHKFNAPIVTMGTLGYADFMDRAFGVITPWSFVPHHILAWNDQLTFSQRVYNTYLSLADLYLRYFEYYPKMNELARAHFGFLETKLGTPLPSVLDLEKKITFMLINSHRSTSPARPSMPGLVNVGGIHVKPPKPLPSDIKKFLDESPDGVVYFCLGSYVPTTQMPKEKLNIFINAIGKLKQRVLWKYEDESLQSQAPKNVMIRSWMPQSDILAHKNIVLFITHGGMFGTQESLHRGVPMLFIPFYGDQYGNAIKAKNAGYALTLSFAELTQQSLDKNLKELLTNDKYTTNVKQASERFRDNPIPPMDEAMYWIEYAIRHKGASYLKSHAVHLSWYSYLLLDVLVAIFLLIGIVTLVLYKIVRILRGKQKHRDVDSLNNNRRSKKQKNK